MEADEPTVDCGVHGPGRRVSFACSHIAYGVLDGTSPGFVINPAPGEQLPAAWCDACQSEALLVGDDDWENWRAKADFKCVCEDCYAEARGLAIGANSFRKLPSQT